MRLSNEQVFKLLKLLLTILRESDPSAELISHGNHKQVRYRNAVFLAKCYTRNQRDTWWCGIMQSHLREFALNWKGAIVLCVDRVAESLEACKVQAVCLPSARVIQMLAFGKAYEGHERVPHYKNPRSTLGAIGVKAVNGDLAMAIRIRARYGPMLTSEERAHADQILAAFKEKGRNLCETQTEKNPHQNFDVVQRGVGCEIKVDGIDKPFPADWVDWRQTAGALDTMMGCPR